MAILRKPAQLPVETHEDVKAMRGAGIKAVSIPPKDRPDPSRPDMAMSGAPKMLAHGGRVRSAIPPDLAGAPDILPPTGTTSADEFASTSDDRNGRQGRSRPVDPTPPAQAPGPGRRLACGQGGLARRPRASPKRIHRPRWRRIRRRPRRTSHAVAPRRSDPARRGGSLHAG